MSADDAESDGSDERLWDFVFPEDDKEIGALSDLHSDEAIWRLSRRAALATKFLGDVAKSSDLVLVVGSGTGLPVEIIGKRFPRIIGVEPNDRAREYAKRHAKGWVFKEDAEKSDVTVFWQSLSRFSLQEIRGYSKGRKAIVISEPIASYVSDPYTARPFRDPTEFPEFAKRLHFALHDARLFEGELADPFRKWYLGSFKKLQE